MAVSLDEVIAPAFYPVYYDVVNERHTHYWLKGGRGSTKSSFVSVMIVLGMVQHSDANAVVIRKVGVYLKDSVYEQLTWAIDKLGLTELWQLKLSPLEMIYLPTGQRILFRGADKPRKLKSTKVSRGYVRYIWFEEVDEFSGIAELRTINQSLMRGGSCFTVFYTYNPPAAMRNWVNAEVATLNADSSALVHHSTYLDVPRAWLGDVFIAEAERLKRTKQEVYRHEYLGEVIGTGGTVFTNVTLRVITDDELQAFDRIIRGVDFGYAADPFVYVLGHYDKTRKRLYIFDEIYRVGLSNARAAELIKEHGHYSQEIVCDSAEPKSIAELRSYGLRVRGAKKGKDSVSYGIKFLQSLDEIVIDNVRAPQTAREFYYYELVSDGNDGYRDGYPDKDNHSIDAVRYAMEGYISNRQARVIERRDIDL